MSDSLDRRTAALVAAHAAYSRFAAELAAALAEHSVTHISELPRPVRRRFIGLRNSLTPLDVLGREAEALERLHAEWLGTRLATDADLPCVRGD